MMMIPPSSPAATQDAEERLAGDLAAENAWDRFVLQKPGDPNHAQLRETLIRRYPNHPKFAGMRFGPLKSLAAEGRWDEYVRVLREGLAETRDFPGFQRGAIAAAAGLAFSPKTPEGVREQIGQTLLPHLRGRASVATNSRAFLANSPGDPPDRYRQAETLEEAVGIMPSMRRFLADFLTPVLSLPGEPVAAREAALRFLSRYGDANPEGRSVRRWLLEKDAAGGSEEARNELDAMDAETRRTREIRESQWPGVVAAIGAGDPERASGVVREFVASLPEFQRETEWIRIVERAANGPREVRLAVYEAFLDSLGADEVSEAAGKAADSLAGEPVENRQAMRLRIRAMKHADFDLSQGTFWKWDSMIAGFVEDPELQAGARRAAAASALRVGGKDLAAEYLYQAERLGWAFDPDRAKANLEKAAALAPSSSAGIRAAWMKEALTTGNPASRPPSPRSFDPSFAIPARVPSLPLPEAGPVPVPVESSDGILRLRANDPPVIAAARSHASSGRLGLADGQLTAPWVPETTPASLLLGLETISPLCGVSVTLDGPMHLTVTLLDKNGGALARFERDWGFWEHFFFSLPWVEGPVALDFPVVDGVAFVRFEVYQAQGDSGITEVKLRTPRFPGTALWTGEPRRIPSGMKSLTIRAAISEPSGNYTLRPGREDFREFNVFRWRTPWRRAGDMPLRGGVAAWFHGNSAEAVVSKKGGFEWSLDGEEIRDFMTPEGGRRTVELANNLGSGPHSLLLRPILIPASRDTGGYNDLMLHELKIRGRSRVVPVVRFSRNGNPWGQWEEAPEGRPVAIPDGDSVQAGLYFDTRGVAAGATAEVRGFEMEFSEDPGGRPVPLVSGGGFPLREDVAAAVAILDSRDAVVVYGKTDDPSLYETARKIAERAGISLVSDDIGLGNFPGRKVVVGTPLRHRYARQLLFTDALWFDPAFLNNSDGLVAVDRQGTVYVTGETPEAVERAGHRVLASQAAHTPEKSPFRLFEASNLETLFPWQLHPGRPAPPAIALRLARGDRRSAQLGLASNRELTDLRVSCSVLVDTEGNSLEKDAALVRVVTGYEWVPFFGQLRLPNLLSGTPVFPVPANTAFGIWLTVKTSAATRPGVYAGHLSVESGGFAVSVPVSVRVEDITLPSAPTIPMLSFSRIPYWFAPGSKLWEAAARSLAENDADHFTSVVFDDLTNSRITWRAMPSVSPAAAAAVAAGGGNPPVWKSVPVKLGPGDACWFRVDEPLPAHPLGVGVTAKSPTALKLEQQTASGEWQTLAVSSRPAESAGVVFFDLPTPLAPGVYRLVPETPQETSVTGIAGFAGGKPFTIEFTALDRWAGIVEAAYRERGVPPPGFLIENKINQAPLARSLFGCETREDLSPFVARELKEFLTARKLDGRVYLKLGDEPRDFADWVRKAVPYRGAGLTTTTGHSANHNNLDAAIGVMDPWMPNYQQQILKPFFRERQNAGDRVWWYICEVPNVRINAPPVNNLPFYWLTAKWNFDGALNYAALHANDYTMPVPFRYEHGMDHRMAILPDASILDSTRRELECDGIRDYELIAFVRRTGNKDLIRELDGLIEATVPNRYGYPMDPAVWHAAREHLYDLAVRAAKRP